MHLTVDQAPENDTDEDPPVYTLYISVHRSCKYEGGFFRQSPWAILDCYVGHHYESEAPCWTQWPQSSATLEHQATSLARILPLIAALKDNADKAS
jgi:hypothetical protein